MPSVIVGAYTFWDAIWTMIVFFAWLMFFWWIVMLLLDNFQRQDHSGLAKAGWAVFLIFFPILGAVAYTITRPAVAVAGPSRYGFAPRGSAADDLVRLNELRTAGALTDAEFEELKRKTIATA